MNPLVEELGGEDKKLISLLEKLEGEDGLHIYHFRKTLRRVRRGEGSVLENLRTEYLPNQFVIKDWNDPYAGLPSVEVGDILEYHESYNVDYLILDRGTEGVITEFGDFGAVSVKFAADPLQRINKVVGEVNRAELIVYGRAGGWFRREKTYPETLGHYLKLKKRDRVKTIAPTYIQERIRIPAGMKGEAISSWDLRLCDTNIVIRRNPHHPLSLIRPNNIDFDKLYRECYQ